ncbi:MAG: tetratricopeptide (TPR) repeat protein [Bacteriovoracaceae bacterium]|jgi:tetratricopeptide (TPR) repeat protein
MKLFLLSLLVLSFGCSSSKVIIRTTPAGAEVFARESGDPIVKSLGVTPLELNDSKLKSIVKNPNKPTILKISKYGHSSEKIIISDFGNADVTYNFTLKENSQAEIITKIDSTSNILFEAQRLMRVGSTDESIKILDALLKKYKQSSFINELMASAYYLQKDYKKSLFYYETAFKYDSKNIEAFKMKKYLEEKLGVSRPLEKGKI